MQFVVVTWLSWCLKITENVVPELLKLLIEIVGKDKVDDETNLMQNIMSLCTFDSILAFFDYFLAEGVALLILKLIFLCQILSISTHLGLDDLLLETIFTLRILYAVLVVAALLVVISRLVNSTLAEGKFFVLDFFFNISNPCLIDSFLAFLDQLLGDLVWLIVRLEELTIVSWHKGNWNEGNLRVSIHIFLSSDLRL